MTSEIKAKISSVLPKLLYPSSCGSSVSRLNNARAIIVTETVSATYTTKATSALAACSRVGFVKPISLKCFLYAASAAAIIIIDKPRANNVTIAIFTFVLSAIAGKIGAKIGSSKKYGAIRARPAISVPAMMPQGLRAWAGAVLEESPNIDHRYQYHYAE